MFISQVYMDKGKRDTARALYNRNILHGAIERCFHGDRQHPLWRIDDKGDKVVLLVVSCEKPDFTSFVTQFGFVEAEPQTKSYDRFLENGINQGETLHFHITANPTIKKNGKRIPLNRNSTEIQNYCAYDWIRDRLKNNGAELINGNVSAYRKYKAKKDDNMITFVSADFDGVLRVKDREKFVSALIHGIGHEKAYGCGLLTVAR
jgi:CRISPR system Cascade subunit CasE